MDVALYKQYQDIQNTHWWFVGRRKIIFNLLEQYFGSKKKSVKILDFGCNTGFLVGELQKQGYNVCGVDVSESAIDFGRAQGVQNILVYNPDNLKLDKDIFPETKFDVIFALDVVEHIEKDQHALEVLRTKLTPQGRIIVMVPAFMMLWGLQDEVAHHFRRYTAGGFNKVATEAHLVVERMTYFNIFLFFPILVFRLIQRVIPTKRSSDFDINNPFLNGVFKVIFCTEAALLKYVKFPFGVSLLAVLKNHEA